MKKGSRAIYLARLDLAADNHQGIVNKINGQINCFESYFDQVDLIAFDNRSIHCSSEGKSELIHNTELGRFSFLRFYYFKFYSVVRDYIISNYSNLEFLFIRHNAPYSSEYVSLLKDLKTKFPQCKVMVEYPNFPPEYSSFKVKLPWELLRKLYWKKFHDYVDIVGNYEYVEDASIFKTPHFQMENGIDVESYLVSEKNSESRDLNLLMVANLSVYQGVDRLIEGLKEYEKLRSRNDGSTKVLLHVVGSGIELQKLKDLTINYRLQDYVKFYGAKKVSELTEYYNLADIGVGTLAYHRLRENPIASSLKVREYCSVGIPFIYSYVDPDFSNEWEYALQFPFDESPIDISKVVSFYNEMNRNNREVIRNYALKKLSWEAKFKPIFDKLGFQKKIS